jgi:MerR family transcriptional regulator, copper efflux regulator
MYKIGQAAKQSGVGIDTIRFYERSGLLQRATRTEAGYRVYDARDVARIRFIRRAKSLGFSLEEIGELLRLNDGDGRRTAVRAIAARRLADIEQRIAEFVRIRDALLTLVGQCHGDGALDSCPIIDAMLSDARPVSGKRGSTHSETKPRR